MIEEINIRISKPIILRLGTASIKKEYITSYIVTSDDIRETLGFVSNFSMYAYEEEVKEGFITIKGGHRIGISGKVVMMANEVKTIKNITSLNIRIARQKIGCAKEVIKKLTMQGFDNTLIISPPCLGKTTLLRELVRLLSDEYKYKVGLVDERGEIAACHMGVPQNDIGIRTDVMDGCKKNLGMMMLVRSMSPQIVAVDELGGADDMEAVRIVGNSGGKIVATIHGSDFKSIANKDFMKNVIKEHFFKYFIVITKDRHINILDENGISDGEVYRFYSDNSRNNINRIQICG